MKHFLICQWNSDTVLIYSLIFREIFPILADIVQELPMEVSREMQTPEGFVELIFPASAVHGKEGPFDYGNMSHFAVERR